MTNKKNSSFWKSLREFENPQVLNEEKGKEFADRVTSQFDPEDLPGISRRKFIALLSASTAFAAASCTDYHDKGEIIPYNKRPEEILPGKPNYYASSCVGCENVCGVLVKTREGRPVKIDGNPEHPINQGKVCSKGQASILNLYDPERLTGPLTGKRKSNWETVNKSIIEELKIASDAGKEIAIISNTITSPTFKKLLGEFVNTYPSTRIYSFEEVDNLAKINAWEKSYGNRNLPGLKIEEAEVILSVDSDFLGKEGNYIENTRKYSSRRDVFSEKEFNRLYVAEAGLSLTGVNADYRLRIKAENYYEFLLALASELVEDGSKFPSIMNEVRNYSLQQFSKEHDFELKSLINLTEDLKKAGKNGIVLAGDTLSEDSHVLVNLINESLNGGNLYDYNSSWTDSKLSSDWEMEQLITNMRDGNVNVLINIAANPVFNLDSRYNFNENLNKVNTLISLVESANETSAKSKFVLPISNVLESWGDHQVRENVVSLQQPVISPIFNTRQKEAIILGFINGGTYSDDIYLSYLKDSFQKLYYSKGNFISSYENFWNSVLHDGYFEIKNKLSHSKMNDVKISSVNKKSSGYNLILTKSTFIGDGRFLNNGWLQEIPNPITKVTWDNYAAISPKSAKTLNVEINDLISVKVKDQKIDLPVMIQPGLAEDTIICELGYGRNEVGEVGKGTGFNVDKFIGLEGNLTPWIYTNVSVSKANGTYELISSQEHHSLDDESVKDVHLKREIVQEGTVEEFKKNPQFMKREEHEPTDLHSSHKYVGQKWAMSIDLNKCTSCAVCVSSCNVENNVPVVGKDQVKVGREMHWLRIDRYFSGEPETPITSNQPMLCQHCDNAPCENVCPVNATNHSEDGLNQMVYNRCVGTRYCSNNCPYKVRRFNFFNFRDHFEDGVYDNELTGLVHNPEVTVRSRGVMEKCSFCVQKIMDVRSEAIREGREIKPNEVVTACQQACPADAIVFGDSNNEKSLVNEYIEHDLSYHILEDLNVKPNVTYIAKLRNTKSEDV